MLRQIRMTSKRGLTGRSMKSQRQGIYLRELIHKHLKIKECRWHIIHGLIQVKMILSVKIV